MIRETVDYPINLQISLILMLVHEFLRNLDTQRACPRMLYCRILDTSYIDTLQLKIIFYFENKNYAISTSPYKKMFLDILNFKRKFAYENN